MAVSTWLSAVGHFVSDVLGSIVGEKIAGKGGGFGAFVGDVARKVRENNPREDLEFILSYVDRLTLSVLATFMNTNPSSVYPRLYIKTRVDGRIGHIAKTILDERYKKLYQGKVWENDFATGLGNGIRRKKDEIDIKETIKLFLYLAELDQKEFKRAMERLKHDPLMGPARVYGSMAVEKVAEVWEYIQDEYPDAEKEAVKQIRRLRKVVQAHNEKKRNEGRVRRWLGI